MSTAIPQKGSGKAPIKSIAPTDSQQKKLKKKKRSSTVDGLQFRSAIKKCLRMVSPDASVKATEKAITVLCCIAHSVLEDMIIIAADLAKKVNKETIGYEDSLGSIEILFTGELRSLCIREIKSAIAKSQTKATGK